MTTFYRTTITINVLSDRDIIEDDIGTIVSNCDEGDCVMASAEVGRSQIDGESMARALTAAGSEPGFFQLDAEGNEVEV